MPTSRTAQLGAAVALALVCAAALTACGRVGEDTEPQHASYDQSITAVRFVDLASSDVQVRVSGDAVEIDRTVRFEADDRSTRPRIEERVSSGVLSVGYTCADGDDVCGVDYRVTVPKGTRIDADVTSGDVALIGPTGPVALTATSGDLSLTGLGGSVELASTSGDVQATGLVAKTVSVSSTSGTVQLGFRSAPTSVQVEATSGDVAVRLPDQAFAVTATTDSGDAKVTGTNDPSAQRSVSVRTTSGDVTVSAADS